MRSFQIGDLVWVKNFGSGKKWLPGRIVRKLGNVNYETILEGMGSNLVHRHVDHLLRRSKVLAIDTDDVFREGEKHVDVELAVVVEQGKGEVEIEEMSGVLGDSEVVNSNSEDSEGEEPVQSQVRRSERVSKKPPWLSKDYVAK